MEQEKKLKEGIEVTIIDFHPQYQQDFKRLNEKWISHYFKMEETDYKSLDHPNEYILNPGGKILVALLNSEVVGVCALIKMDGKTYELAKMAVADKIKGKGIGEQLGRAAIAKAIKLGAEKIYLESNTVLEPAIKLYDKLGFKKVTGITSPYERCNIQMILKL